MWVKIINEHASTLFTGGSINEGNINFLTNQTAPAWFASFPDD
jgi:hypothetical protein